MSEIQSSKVLKAICYCIIPFFVLLIIINTFSITYYSTYQEDIDGKTTYFETERFAEDLLGTIYTSTRRILRNTKYPNIESDMEEAVETSQNTTIELSNQTEEAQENNTNVNSKEIMYNTSYIGDYSFEILIIDEDGNIYTNVEKTTQTDTLEEIKQYIQSKTYNWIYDNGRIDTTIKKMSYDNIAYNYMFEEVVSSGYKVYACVRNEDIGEFQIYNTMYSIVSQTYQSAPSVLIISAFLLVIACIYIIFSIGHKKGEEGIYTDSLDKVYFEIVALASGALLTFESVVLVTLLQILKDITNITSSMLNTGILSCILIGFVIYATLAITLVTIIRRIKAKIFWKNTICYKFIKWVKRNTTDLVFKDINSSKKLVLAFGGFIVIQAILIIASLSSLVYVILLLGFWYIVFKILLEKVIGMNKIRNKIQNMNNGNVDNHLNEMEFKSEQKQIAKELNDISGGLSNAINEAMKSERLKTELITNVSHDIKTPLTSIINYVDLMKNENIENEKVQEYLEILDNKSQRLKKLTEDLVEASKASSGNIKLNMEKLNLKELIKQVRGEFEDKFETRGLVIIETLPEEDIYIQADSRYMYRVLENMYVNISKYALDNSRVYIDVEKDDTTAKVILKNISKDELNIGVDELMQRFVRGDSSRSTEGSGLGISIAKSLTELQKGKFNIYLDGDLFKVVLEFKVI